MTNSLPLVSVLMTAYNREIYIAQAIESVLQSTYTNFELIIVDDGSTDSTLSIAKKYAEADERVYVYQNETNLGDYNNRNRAASLAKGMLYKYLDSDDVIYPCSIEIIILKSSLIGNGRLSVRGGFIFKPVAKDGYLNSFIKRRAGHLPFGCTPLAYAA